MEGQLRPRTHRVLVVELGRATHLLDVGFSGDGLLPPLALHGAPYDEYGGTLRADSQGSEVVLRQVQGDGWEDVSSFVPEARYPIHFTVANCFTSTDPDGVFVKTLTVQRATPAARHSLRQLTYTVRAGAIETSRELGRDELIPLLRETFGIDLPGTTWFAALDGDRPQSRFNRRGRAGGIRA